MNHLTPFAMMVSFGKPEQILAIVGGAAVGAFLFGLIAQLLSRWLTTKPMPSFAVNTIRLVGAVLCGLLTAMWVWPGDGWGPGVDLNRSAKPISFLEGMRARRVVDRPKIPDAACSIPAVPRKIGGAAELGHRPSYQTPADRWSNGAPEHSVAAYQPHLKHCSLHPSLFSPFAFIVRLSSYAGL